MERALELARRGAGHVRPNPPVGAVIVAEDGRVAGEGWHRKAGGDHAETAAIKNARERGAKTLEGATVYVSLEPCSKPGRVGACTDAIAAAGISRVVYAIPDPNPVNRGGAKRALAKHGIECVEWSGRGDGIAEAAKRLIAPFAKHVATGMPYVAVKIAMSIDGRICDAKGEAKWISSEVSRKRTGAARETFDAIMVGAETVRRDNPSLLSHGVRNDDLVRVVVSKSGRLPESAQVFTDGAPNKTLVFDDAEKALRELGRAGITSVLCEGGFTLARSLAAAGLVDEWRAIVAPLVIGDGPLASAARFSLVSLGESDPAAGDVEISYSARGAW